MNTLWGGMRMGMNLFQNLIMGFISGFSELLPISAEAHRSLLRLFFDVESEGALFLLLVHTACLIALILQCRNTIFKIRHTRHLEKIPARRRRTQPDTQSLYTVRLLRSATVVMVALKLLTPMLSFIQNRINFLAIALVCNGIFLILPALCRSGNKDSRNMPRVDGLLMGLGAGLSAIPGISAVGAAASFGIARGVDRRYAFEFTKLIMIRVLVMDIAFDLLQMLSGGVAFSGSLLLFAILAGLLAAAGVVLALKLMKFLIDNTGLTGFAYYNWGLALFSFILFLTV